MNRRSHRKLILVVLLIVLALQLTIVYMFASKQQDKQSASALISKEKTKVQELAQKAVPAVVYIQVDNNKAGSGVIVSNDGYILTNYHVISNSKNISARLEDKRIFNAKLIGSDPQTDVALIKVEAKNLPTIELGNSDFVEVGDNIMAIGNPFGFDFTVTTGIISATHREYGPTEYRDFLQTDASINPGNSGGPLIDMNGKIVGITTFIVSDVRSGELGFAIPINLIKTIMDMLIKNGKIERSYLGVSLQDKVELDSNGNGRIIDGAEIVSFDPKGPAAKSGLKEGDIIVKINDKKITDSNTLRNYVAYIPVGNNVEVTVLRSNKEMMFNVTSILRPNF
ncbi:trypsin-like peptidase domain-containing protein [Candidatus Woesearchaeota archaeon]|nr:trypsin-like peptidase domain-containing protein [Candidatus Woesearchaeota archaeon]